MTPVPLPTRVFLACGVTDMRKGFDGLAVLVQQVLAQDPHSGALFAFRGKRGHLVKLLWFDGQGLCLFSSRIRASLMFWSGQVPRKSGSPHGVRGSGWPEVACAPTWPGCALAVAATRHADATRAILNDFISPSGSLRRYALLTALVCTRREYGQPQSRPG